MVVRMTLHIMTRPRKGGSRHHRLAQHPRQHHRDILTDEADRRRRKLLWVELCYPEYYRTRNCVIMTRRHYMGEWTFMIKNGERDWYIFWRNLLMHINQHTFHSPGPWAGLSFFHSHNIHTMILQRLRDLVNIWEWWCHESHSIFLMGRKLMTYVYWVIDHIEYLPLCTHCNILSMTMMCPSLFTLGY